MKRFIVAFVLAIVLLVTGCASSIPIPAIPVTPDSQVKLDNAITYIDIGYTNNDPRFGKPLGNIIYGPVPQGVKTIVCVVTMTCRKGTPLASVWWYDGVRIGNWNTNAPRDLNNEGYVFWFYIPNDVPSGKWMFQVIMPGGISKSLEFIVRPGI